MTVPLQLTGEVNNLGLKFILQNVLLNIYLRTSKTCTVFLPSYTNTSGSLEER